MFHGLSGVECRAILISLGVLTAIDHENDEMNEKEKIADFLS
jgi:hypothetical protein